MICILLCAGYATRMYPLTENFPKPLLPVKGKPLINYLIDDLNTKNYISEYVIISNHKFINHFNEWKDKYKFDNVVILDDGSTENDNRLGAVKDIEFALDSLKINDDILVLAGDNLLEFSLNSFIEYYYTKNTNCIMYYNENEIERLKRTGVAEINDDGLVISMEEKPSKPKSNCAIPPFYIFKKECLKEFRNEINDGCKVDSPGCFIEWFCKRNKTYAYLMPGKRIDIGNLEDYKAIK